MADDVTKGVPRLMTNDSGSLRKMGEKISDEEAKALDPRRESFRV